MSVSSVTSALNPSIRSASLHGFIDLAQSLKLNASELLAQVGIERSSLDSGDSPISVNAACELLERAAHLSGASNFGLQLAARRRLSNLGLIGLVLREEPTGLAMLETLCRYLTLINSTLSTQVEQKNDHLIIREALLLAPSVQKTQSIELAVGVMVRILFEIMGEQWSPHSVCFQHTSPVDLKLHKQLFKAPLRFNATFNGIVCKKTDFERRLPNTEPSSVATLRLSLDAALSSQQQSQQSAADRVSALIKVMLPTGRCRLTHIARHFGVSTRTIHRQLRTENTHFEALLSAVRQQVVARHLSDTRCSMQELSTLLGFKALPAFSHWFQSIHQVSASEWRQAHKATP